jgi:hypothetical protein
VARPESGKGVQEAPPPRSLLPKVQGTSTLIPMRLVDPHTGKSYLEKRRRSGNGRARWYAGIRPVKLEMDDSVLLELARG